MGGVFGDRCAGRERSRELDWRMERRAGRAKVQEVAQGEAQLAALKIAKVK
jgi:hypothetical protein